MSSRRRYTTIAEVEQLADVTSTDNAEFEDKISQAEEFIDAYVGPQQKHVPRTLNGKLTAVNSTTLIDTSADTHFDRDDNYYAYCVIEIIGGAGVGQQRFITGSNKAAKSITIDSAFSTPVDTTSIYKIYQLGKFPRHKDVYHESDDLVYYKSIPEAVKRATAAQVQFMIEMGDNYFAGDDAEMDSERLLNYSYSRGGNAGQSAVVKFLSPRARTILRGIKNRTGQIAVDHP